MEIERKYLIEKEQLPADLASYPFHKIEQGYLCTSPVVRIRRQDDDYFLTYKSKGLMAREEYNLPLTQEAYEHLKSKADDGFSVALSGLRVKHFFLRRLRRTKVRAGNATPSNAR